MSDKLLKRLEKYKLIGADSDCWLWTGAKTQDGYGKIKHKGKTTTAHRLSAALFLGLDLSSDTQVNHKRECKNKHCFNPTHLYLGTQIENAEDRKALNLTCSKGHSYSLNTPYVDKLGNRYCIVCRRESTQRKRAKLNA